MVDGENVLIKSIVEQFCPRFAPGGAVVYIGDAGKDYAVFDEGALTELGVARDEHGEHGEHGELPDLVIHRGDRDWLLLIEASSSHGPIDSKRHAELDHLFARARPGLAYVSCFHSRAEMSECPDQIAWETGVWCAEDPTHMIHFNGQRFLGPYA